MKFRTILLQAGKTATGIEVPADIVERLGAGKRPPVRVAINGHTYRSTVAVMGGQFLVPVSAENREKAGVAGGEEIEVDLKLDTEARDVVVPPDLAEALGGNAAARQRFEALSYSRRKALVTVIEGAKTEETRQRRLGKTIDDLLAG
ncbi:YdeI/OmpD-associated family protein [Inquilinus sp. CA228]|uniref:YdeI/OmpD-associated family protein n=1 Tax=Inquilinus sp. CA228 TaxID=3455609 RepID=UPI003F8D5C7C